MTYEQLDKSIDADSDSEDEMAVQAHAYKGRYPFCSDSKDILTPDSPVSQRQGELQ